MKLLIVTQKVDAADPILGFFMRWIEEFARHVESVSVICLERGEGKVPENVRVLSLGKEIGLSRISYIIRFFRYIWTERARYDAVFVHMNPVYLVLGGIFWKLLGKRIGLWYTHKSVDMKLRVAEKFADIIFTASKESFRLRSKKVLVTGHGIDTELFKPRSSRQPHAEFTVLSVGRISPVKKHETAIFMAEAMRRLGQPVKLLIIGRPVLKRDEEYMNRLKDYVRRQGLADSVTFLGSMPNHEMAAYFRNADVLVNSSETGSLDKVVLEAMSAGLISVTSNEAFAEMLAPFGLAVKSGNAAEMAGIAARMADESKRRKLGGQLREIVVRDHNLSGLISKIIERLRQ